MDVADLLHCLVLFNGLPEFYDIALESVVLTVPFEVVDIGEQRLVVSQRHTLQVLHPAAAHLSENSPDEVDGTEHFLH